MVGAPASGGRRSQGGHHARQDHEQAGTPVTQSQAHEIRRQNGCPAQESAQTAAKAAKPRGARQGTKQALLIGLLKRKTGATIADLVHATGWHAHSVRGAISGTLKKKLGLTVTSEPIEKRGRVYRIVGRIVGRG